MEKSRSLLLGFIVIIALSACILIPSVQEIDADNTTYSIGDAEHGIGTYTVAGDPQVATLTGITSVGADNTFTVPLYIDVEGSLAVYSGTSNAIPVTTVGDGKNAIAKGTNYTVLITGNVKTMAVGCFGNSPNCRIAFDGATGIHFYKNSIPPDSNNHYTIPDGSTLEAFCLQGATDNDVIRIGSDCECAASSTLKYFPVLAMKTLKVYSDTPIEDLLPTAAIKATKDYNEENEPNPTANWTYSKRFQVWENVENVSTMLTEVQKETYFHGYFIDDGNLTEVSKIITNDANRYYLKSDVTSESYVDWDSSTGVVESQKLVISIAETDGADVAMSITHDGTTYYSVNGKIEMPIPSNGTVLTVSKAQWTVKFYDGEDGNVLSTQVVDDGSTLTVPEVPSKDGCIFDCWQLNGSEFSFNTSVRSNLDLIATWQEGQSHSIEVSSACGTIAIASGVDSNGKVLDGDTVTMTFVCPEKVEIQSWTVVIGTVTQTYTSSDASSGITFSGSLLETISIANIHDDITVSVNIRYISESNTPEPTVSTDMPTSTSDLVNRWRFGGGLDKEGMVWKGGMGEPLILDDYVYVRDGCYLYKIDAETGLVLASAPSEMGTTYYHQLGYLGQGRILDYLTEKVYDEDLKDLGYKVKDWAVFDDSTGCFYTVGSDYVCKYSSSSSVTDGYLTPEWKVSVSETVDSETKKYSVFRMYNAVSQPLILGDRIYWLSSEYTDESQNEWNVYLCYTSGDGFSHVELTGLKTKLLDNGWLTTDGTNIYVTSYGVGLLNGGPGGAGILAVYYPAEDAASYFTLNASTLVSAFVPVGDIAFVKGDARIMVYSMDSFAYGGSSSITIPSRISELEGLERSHGSITVNTAHLDEGKVYIYFAGYESGNIYVCVYDIGTNTWTYGKMNDTHTNSSQGIKTTISGDLIYYDDSHQLFCYTISERNSYKFYVSNGTETIIAEGSDANPETVAGATGLISTSSGNLLGARTSESADWETGYSLYALVSGVWTSQSSFVNDINYPMWAIVKNDSQLPSNGTEATTIDGGSYKYDYVAGHTVTTSLNGEKISNVSMYEGMILTISTGLICDGELEDMTKGLTVSGTGECETKWVLADEVIGIETKKVVILIVKNIPDDDMDISITIASYGVKFDLDGGESSSITADSGWTYDSEAGTWSKSFQSGVAFPTIADPTKTGSGYTYEFASWSPELPTTVSGSGTYKATYTSTPISTTYVITLNLDGGESSSITADSGWTHDSTAGTWSKSFESGTQFPTIADPTKAGSGVVYTFKEWSEAFPATVTESKTYTATYTSSAIAGIQYGMSYQATDSGAMRTYTITIERSSGTEDIDDARLLVIANYGGHYINVYSKIDLDTNGHAVETVKLSTDGLTGLNFEIVEGFPTGAYDSYGLLSPSLA